MIEQVSHCPAAAGSRRTKPVVADVGDKLGQHLGRPGLPAEVSSLVGRGPQIAAILNSLHTARVVTLTGPGGCGKTRLALRAATLAAVSFDDGARLVELASLTNPSLVPVSVAQALGVPEQDAANRITGVARAVADRELLVVLDNCEHVLGSASRVVVMLAGRLTGARWSR
jgi:predicted ATPase